MREDVVVDIFTAGAQAAGPLLAQATTAPAPLEHAEREDPDDDDNPVFDWACRNL